MAEAAVGATIQVLIENLLTISQEQISLVRDFKDDLETLKKSLSMVQDFLHDAEKKQVNESAVKRWLRDLEDLAFDADNVLDEINYQLLSKKVEATRNISAKKKVQSFFSNNNPIAYRLKIGRRIRDINEKLKSINQQAIGFGLQNIVAQAPVYGSDPSATMETDSFSEDSVTLGRENDVSRIVEMLITTSSVDRKLSVLPIVGMGGLGKTTLARLVFGHANINTHFEIRVWVHVPRNFDVIFLLKRILTSMTTENVEHGNREALLKKLQFNLGAKKYLLVLDDVWNEDKEKWDDFVKSFLGISSIVGNCMIVTTRSEAVASIVETLPIHKLKGLSEDDCWVIIKAKAFRGGDNSLEFEEMGKIISNKCQGLPLAAKVVGGLLFDKSRDEWMSIEKNWLSDLGDENPISKILKVSFDNLSSSSLKKCFAYCSIFPKGYKIEKEQLIELWMAEGFLQIDNQRGNIDMETTGRKFFNLLLQSSLLQLLPIDYCEITLTYCNMHDLVHDLASHSWYIIGHKKSIGDEKYARSLFVDGKVSDIKFSDFESLRTLTLRDGKINELPTSIRKLKHLRYLDISETGIKYLPDSIGVLYHLQTLRFHSRIKNLPNSFRDLISLRHLYIFRWTTLPPGIGKLTSLRTMPYFCVRDEKACRISELENLKDLKGYLEIHNLEKVLDKIEATRANLLRKPGIYDLKFAWDPSREGSEYGDESVLEGLQPHPNLKFLEICGFKGKSLPLWTSKMAVQLDGHYWEGLINLMEIKLEDCSEFEELPMLGHLPHLKSLYLRGLTNVRYIGASFYGRIANSSINGVYRVFRALESLKLLGMTNLKEWAEVDFPKLNEFDETQLYEIVVFPRLEYLCVNGCTQLMSAPSHFPCLKNLTIGEMESSLPLENICGMKLTSLTHLEIVEIKGMVCLPEGLLVNNCNLSDLRIVGCPDMTHLVPCLQGGGASLRELNISHCSSLRELPNDLHNLHSLEELCISGCPELKSITYPSRGGGGGQHGFTSLRKLEVYNCGG